MTTKEKAYKLSELSECENTEIGEIWDIIANIYLYKRDYITEDFHLQMGVEIEIQYQFALDMIEDGELVIE